MNGNAMPFARRRPALLLAAAASAQPFETPPPPAAPRPLAIAAPVEKALPNGLRVIVAPREGVPLVTAMLVVLSGSELDPPQLSGLASMTAGLLTQGTRRHTGPEIAAAAEALGGSLDSGAGWSQSLVAITVTTPRLGAALGLVAEVAREPTFAPAELDRLRNQTLDALKVSYADPGAMAGLTAARLAYGSGAWGHPASGTPASLPRIRQADLVALHRATFRPDRAVLILTGDIGLERAPRPGQHPFRHLGCARRRRAAEARRRRRRWPAGRRWRWSTCPPPARPASSSPSRCRLGKAPSGPRPTCSTRCWGAATRRASARKSGSSAA